jgi:hypothetical protein
MNTEEQNIWDRIVTKAWQDESFKKRLLAEPALLLKEHGLEIQPDKQLRLFEDTDRILHLVLPAKPSGELTDADLDAVAGGLSNTSFRVNTLTFSSNATGSQL